MELVSREEYDRAVAESVEARRVITALKKTYADERKHGEGLKAELASQKEQCCDLMANCNQLRERAWKAEGQVAALQQALIEERARRNHSDYDDLPEEDQVERRYFENDDFLDLTHYGKAHWRAEAKEQLASLLANPVKVIIPAEGDAEALARVISDLERYLGEDHTRSFNAQDIEVLKRYVEALNG